MEVLPSEDEESTHVAPPISNLQLTSFEDIAEKLVSLGVIEDVPAVATIPGEAGEAQNP